MSGLLPLLSGTLLLAGAALLLVASIGLLRFPDLYTRMHAVLKAGTIGAVLVLASLVVAAPATDIVVRLAGALLLLVVGAPFGAFLLSGLARAGGSGPASRPSNRGAGRRPAAADTG